MTDTRERALSQLATEGRVTLRGRALRMWLLWLLCLVLAAACLAIIIGPLTNLPFGSSRRDSWFTVAMGAFGVLFFGVLGTAVLPLRATRQSKALVLDRDGLRIEGSTPIPWGWVRSVVPGEGRHASVTLAVDPNALRAWSAHQRRTRRMALRGHRGIVRVPPLKGMQPADAVAVIIAAGDRLA